MKRSAPLTRRSSLSPVSSRRRRALDTYRQLRSDYLGRKPVCECCGKRSSTDVHHKAGRREGNYLKVDTWMAVCRLCHDYIHRFPKLARTLGYLQVSVRVRNQSQPTHP